jgi:hypothetical protein
LAIRPIISLADMARPSAIRLGLGSGIGLLPKRETVANGLDEIGAASRRRSPAVAVI